MTVTTKYDDVLRLARLLVKAEADSLKTAARTAADALSSRAASTTANARWSRAAEYRDRVAHQLHVAVARAGLAERFEESYYGEAVAGDKWHQTKVLRERP